MFYLVIWHQYSWKLFFIEIVTRCGQVLENKRLQNRKEQNLLIKLQLLAHMFRQIYKIINKIILMPSSRTNRLKASIDRTIEGFEAEFKWFEFRILFILTQAVFGNDVRLSTPGTCILAL